VAFFDAIVDPPEPLEWLKRAVAGHKRRIAHRTDIVG
jgi:hypothetical protein